jgi:serine/threonine protein kinase
MSVQINNLINNINNMDQTTFNKINAGENVIMLGQMKLIFIGKGGEGIIYGIDKYAIKFYKTNKSSYTEKYTNKGNTKEMMILEESTKLVNNNVTNNFLKLYAVTEIFKHTVIVLDLVNGDLESWTDVQHNDNEWLSMIFQLLYATFIMQMCLKIYHHDLKPKNMLFKRLDKPSTIKYVIKTNDKEHTFLIDVNTIFLITDFGQASTLLSKSNVYIPETIQISIDNNLDLEHLAVFHNRQAVTLLKNAYIVKDLIEIGKNDKNFQSYYDYHYNKIRKNMKGYPPKVIESMLFRALGYYVIEKKLIDISDIPNVNNKIFLPTKKIQHVLESLSELKGKGTLLNKIIEIGNIINNNNLKEDITLCVSV